MSSSNNIITYDDLPLWSAPFGLTLLETVRMKTLMNVLDIGSGSGFPMLELAERMGKKCMVYGLDPSEEAIRMITAKKEARGIVFAKIVKGIAEEIPFPDQYFGLIVSNNGLNNVSDQAKALAECFRVAEEEAQLVLTMNLPHTMTEFYEVFAETLEQLGLHDEVTKMHEHIHFKRKTVEYLKDLILGAGFEINTINVDGFKMRYNDGTAFMNHSFIRGAFMDSWKAILPETMVIRVFADIEQRLNQIALDKGELVMSIPYVCFDAVKPKQTV
ncbi:MAG: class I SAM-dependent methyltransferase [Bacteroidales bacterium]